MAQDPWAAFDVRPGETPAAVAADPWAAFDAQPGDAPLPAARPASPRLQRPFEMPDLAPNQGAEMPGVPGPSLHFPTISGVRQALAPTPGWVSSGVLPLATREVSPGQGDPSAGIRLDWGPIRSLANPLLDLLEGTGLSDQGSAAPLAGKVTPEATALLFGAMAGNPNPFQPHAQIMRPPFSGPAVAPVIERAAPQRAAPEPALVPALVPAGPKPAGAQLSTAAEAGLSPAQEAAYRATAEGQKLLETQIPGERDATLYIRGVHPNTVEIEQTVHHARDLKMLGQKVPDVAQEAKQIATANSEARLRHYDDSAGSPVDLANAEAARAEQGQADLAAAWANKKAADAQPVVDAADAMLRGPSGKQDAVTRNVRAIRDKLFDADGGIETDPEILYGVRKEINNRLSKEAAREEPTNQLAARELIQLRDLLDKAIEPAAQGFGAYLKNWRNASRRIDEMGVLQDHRAGLFDSANRMQYSRVQRAMRNIVDSRMAPGANPYHSITPETMARLWALRDDLRRSASAADLALAAGSDTFQNAWHALRDAAKGQTAGAVAAGLGALVGGPPGAVIGSVVHRGIATALANRAMRQNRERGMQMLHPDTPLRNPLGPDEAGPPSPPPGGPQSPPPAAGPQSPPPPGGPQSPPPAAGPQSPPPPAGGNAPPGARPAAPPPPPAPAPPPAPPGAMLPPNALAGPTQAAPASLPVPPRPAPAPAAEPNMLAWQPAAAGAAVPADPGLPDVGLRVLDPRQIKVDARRFQFKEGGDEAGVTERLQGVSRWDPTLAGVSLVYRDPAGQHWIADGHQRLALAQRLLAQGHPPIGLPARVLDAAAGYTAADARAIAAVKNIAEGTGTSLDAAKVLREAGASGVSLPPLPPMSALVREGRAMANLGPDAWGMAINGVVPTNQAAIVGRVLSDPLQQAEAMRVLARTKPENLRQAEMIVRDVGATSQETLQQGGLFGDEAFASSVTLERAAIADEAAKQLVRDRTVFRTLVREENRIGEQGANVLDTASNQRRLTDDERAAELIGTLATTHGPISDALTGLARQLKAGTISRADAARSFLGHVRGADAAGVAPGASPGG